MKKIRILAIFAVLVAILIPLTVSAAGVFYCSTSVTTGGTGSISDPWACSTAAQLDTVINDNICDIYSGGYLYQVYPDSYRYHVVTWYSVDDCRVTSQLIMPGSHRIRELMCPLPISLALLPWSERDCWPWV